MKKIVSVLACAVMVITMLAACGSKEVALDVNQLANRLATEITYEDQLSETTADMAQMLYGYQKDQVTNAKLYISAGATTEEVAVLECKDEAAATAVKTAAEARIEAQKVSVKSYKPEELNRLDDALLTVKGKYVILSISNDKAKAQSIIDEAAK